ncbi:MAG TPA: alpha/beta fold hydrolase [Actinomycetota bacterium]
MSAPADTRAPARPSAIHRHGRLRPSAPGTSRLAAAACGAVVLYGLAALVVLPEGDPSLLARLISAAALVTAASVAVGVIRWGAARAGGAVILLVGFTMMAVAGGVVAKRLVDDVSLVDLLGAAASIAGVILVVAGWKLSLAGIARRWMRPTIAILATLLVAQFLLLPAGVALDVTNRPRPTGSGRTPADVGLRFQDVRIPSADGTLLSAWWIAPENGAAIILLPGSGSTRHTVLDHAALVARHGYGALLIDWRGHGESEGRSMEFGWGAEPDVSAAVSFALGRPGVTRGVGVLGLSLGGEVGLAATALDPRIGAAVAEGISARSWADARLEPDPHPVGYVNQWLTFVFVDILAPEPRPLPLIDLITRIDAPVLMISGAPPSERKLDPVYADAAPDVITLWPLPDTPHTRALGTHPAEYERRVIGVFDGALLDNGAVAPNG